MRKRPPSPQRRQGFTIVEIIVVVIMIACLATLILPQLFSRIGQTKQGVAKAKLVEIEKAIEIYSLDYGQLPQDLDDLVNRPADIPEEKWSQPTIKAKDLIDPWGRKFIYRQPGEHGPYDLYCLGADAEVGGEKDNADVVNW